MKKKVYVGVTAATTSRETGSITNAALGYIHEFGSPARNIPARPWLAPGVNSNKPQIEKRLKGTANLALKGKPEEIAQQQNALGLETVSAVQSYMSDPAHFTPLSDSTTDARKRKGQTEFSPLIDTGALRRSVTYAIKDK